MNLLTLDALLLFALSIPVVMRYRILPITGTPYWLFGILFFILLCNMLISLYPIIKKPAHVLRLKLFFLLTTLFIVVGGTTITAIIDRNNTAPVYGVHDIILQQEAAMRYLLIGKNPYKETYFGTPVEQFHYDELDKPSGKSAINPALYHFVMPPWYLLFPFLFYFISTPLLGFFDGRMVLLFSLAGLIYILYRWFVDKKIAHVVIALTALSPAFVDYFIEGRSDMFALFWFVWSLYLLDKKKFVASSIIFALALLSKQTIWFAVPFYFIYAWLMFKKSLKTTIIKVIMPSVLIVFALVLPFLLWDARAFVDSIIFYLSGNSASAYPISGYGWGMLLYSLGIIKNIHAYYPFIIWQTVIGLPIMGVTLWWMTKKLSMSRLLVGYGVTLMVIWYVSRYFNNSHLGYLSSVFVLGVLKDWDEKGTA